MTSVTPAPRLLIPLHLHFSLSCYLLFFYVSLVNHYPSGTDEVEFSEPADVNPGTSFFTEVHYVFTTPTFFSLLMKILYAANFLNASLFLFFLRLAFLLRPDHTSHRAHPFLRGPKTHQRNQKVFKHDFSSSFFKPECKFSPKFPRGGGEQSLCTPRRGRFSSDTLVRRPKKICVVC